MIEKARLEELIKAGATIYITSGKETDLKKIEIEFGRNRLIIINRQENIWNYWKYEELFETQKEAEHDAKFGHMERVEKLSLPTWEEFKKLKWNERIYFTGKNTETYFIQHFQNEVEIRLCREYDLTDIIFDKQLTEANYNEACELVKKLFEVEE